MDNKLNLFQYLTEHLRDYSEGEAWTNGLELLFRTKEQAEGMKDILEVLDPFDRDYILGQYDRKEPDRHSGWWYLYPQGDFL